MPKEFSRALRLGDQIQRELAELIGREIQDPRVGMVTITAVQITSNLADAKVYVTVLGDAATTHASLRALQGAAGFLRNALARRLSIRIIPTLHFVHDASVVRGIHLGALIDAAIAADRQRHEDLAPKQEPFDSLEKDV